MGKGCHQLCIVISIIKPNTVDGFEGVHGGYGFGRRNVDGEMLLEFSDALDLDIVNTWFKEVRKMITYKTKACKTVIDFFLIRKRERKLVRDVTR